MQTDAYAYTSANIAKGTTVCLQVVYSVHELTDVGLAYTWESGGVLAVLGFGSFPTEALALPT